MEILGNNCNIYWMYITKNGVVDNKCGAQMKSLWEHHSPLYPHPRHHSHSLAILVVVGGILFEAGVWKDLLEAAGVYRFSSSIRASHSCRVDNMDGPRPLKEGERWGKRISTDRRFYSAWRSLRAIKVRKLHDCAILKRWSWIVCGISIVVDPIFAFKHDKIR